tara:strand:- start:658 stop:1311 length:654 start_codon:yes stop_codon:yes gene_type:complete
MHEIICDVRERSVISLLDKCNNVSIVQKQLDVGDFIIENDFGRIIIERKTRDDLSASITDGRYKEQKNRLHLCKESGNIIVYIIEGSHKTSHKGVPESTVTSAIISCVLKDKFFVLPSYNLQDTAFILQTIASKSNSSPSSSIITQSLQKKSFSNTYINILSCIPGISSTIAHNIHSHFNTLEKLMNELKENGKNALTKIPKIGPKISENIYNALLK